MRDAVRRYRARGDEGGLTLIELLVSMAIFSGVLASVYGVLISVQRQSVDVQARESSVGNARLALAQMDRQIRSGSVLFDPAVQTLPLSMLIYTQADGEKRCVQWQVETSNGTLRTRSWPTTWPEVGVVTPWAVTGRGVVNTTTPFVLQGGSTPYSSRLVDIRLLVKDPKAGGQPIEVQTSLSGRNTEYGSDTGSCTTTPTA